MRGVAILIALIIAFVGGYWFRGQSVEVIETVKVETIYYESPKEYTSSTEQIKVNLPIVLFAPNDTIRTEKIIYQIDSVEVELTKETRQYKDSTYTAQISGIAIGPHRPTLDWIETYNTTTTQIVKTKPRVVFSVGVGAGYDGKEIKPYLGAQVGIPIKTW